MADVLSMQLERERGKGGGLLAGLLPGESEGDQWKDDHGHSRGGAGSKGFRGGD